MVFHRAPGDQKQPQSFLDVAQPFVGFLAQKARKPLGKLFYGDRYNVGGTPARDEMVAPGTALGRHSADGAHYNQGFLARQIVDYILHMLKLAEALAAKQHFAEYCRCYTSTPQGLCLKVLKAPNQAPLGITNLK